jgi:hypothetical protein
MVKQSSTERMALNELESDGYFVIKSAGSFGLFDFIAWKDGPVRLIQVKKTQGPRAEERQALNDFHHLQCPHCRGVITTKEIWLYQTKKGVKSIPKIELLA